MYIISGNGQPVKAEGGKEVILSKQDIKFVNNCIWHFKCGRREIIYISAGNKKEEEMLLYLIHIKREQRVLSYVKNLFPGMMRSYIDFRTEDKEHMADLFHFIEEICRETVV